MSQDTVTTKIVSRWNLNTVLFECEVPAKIESGLRTRYALEKAVQGDANLSGANLSGAYLSGAHLSDANLSGAYLSDAYLGDAYLSGAYLGGANLSGAYLSDANLSGAYLSGAYLGDAYLSGAYLGGANLSYANLSGAYLGGANLSGANLSGANLSGAYLIPIKADVWEILMHAPAEIPALRAALIEGRVDGSTYSGACACLVGTLAKARDVGENDLPGISPDGSRPAERWFLAINKGDTPETNQASKLALEWVDEFTMLLDAAKVAA